MEPLATEQRRLTAFRATDAFAVEAYRIARALPRDSGGLADEIRRAAARSGGAVIAASAADPGCEDERRQIERARRALFEGRYYLYLARRFGLLDSRRYRAITVRQDSALRELAAVLRPRSP